jgi:hypothetical protein
MSRFIFKEKLLQSHGWQYRQSELKSKLVSAGCQEDSLVAWFEVEKQEDEEPVRSTDLIDIYSNKIFVAATGRKIPDGLDFLQTVQIEKTGIVWHIFVPKE